MNWEQITIDKKTNDTQNIKPNNFNFTTRPNVIEKIEKFNSNNLIQLINQQTSCAVKKMKKTRINSGITIINFYFKFLKISF